MTKRLHSVLLLLLAAFIPRLALAADEPLPVEQVFLYTTSASDDTITVQWEIKPGHYLYKSRLGFSTDTPGISLGEAQMRKGKMKEDEFFGIQETFRDELEIKLPYTRRGNETSLNLKIKSQGCSDKGLCYPPQRWQADVALPQLAATSSGANQNEGLLDSLVTRNEFGSNAREILPPEEAFRMSAQMIDDYTLLIRWDIEDGHYLYRDKFEITANSELVQLGAANWPGGQRKFDEHFGEVQVFYGNAEAQVPVSRASPAAGELELTVAYQGCVEDSICYPPGTQTTLVSVDTASTDAPLRTIAGGAEKVSEQDFLANKLRDSSLLGVIALFFISGVGLAFTPCVLPMVPILSGIIGGQKGEVTTRRSFMLSLVYVLAMALTYTVIGVIVGLIGGNIQAAFQNPIVLIVFSTVFVVLALAMFDVWQFQMPVALQNKMNQFGSGGGYAGVGVMGVLSALIVGPCVAAPLVGALIFIGQSGDAVRGGIALFALSIGMGTPLLAYGASAGQLMIRAGAWMEVVKRLFGVLLLGVAIWLIGRILPDRVVMLLWAVLAFITAWSFGLFSKPAPTWLRAVGAAFAAYGLVLLGSASMGGYDPISPLRGTAWGEHEKHLEFERIKTVADLELAVSKYTAAGKNVMLDFYADWCVSCKEMEKYTFTNPDVHTAFANTALLQADVTANDDADKALLEYFGIYGPPTIAFFDRNGNERKNYRVVGFMNAEDFARHSREAVAQ